MTPFIVKNGLNPITVLVLDTKSVSTIPPNVQIPVDNSLAQNPTPGAQIPPNNTSDLG